MRNHYLVQSLAARHQVWASFCGVDGGEEYCGELPLRGEGLPALFDPLFLYRASQAIKEHKIEQIVSSSLISGLHGALLKILTGRPFWMDQHNVEWHCSRRYGHRFWWLIYLLEGFIVKMADQVTCVSDDDRERLISYFRLAPHRVTVAPNGVDYPKLMKAPVPTTKRDKARVLFFGVLNYPPNREAVEFLAEEVAPALDDEIEVVVAGKGGEDLQSRFPRLSFLGFVDDIHALVKECDGVVVPIFSGGGTRMKILETLACGRPVVSTECGAEGIDRRVTGEALTIAESAEEMIAWIKALPVGGEASVPESFRELYDWSTIWQNKAPL